MHKLLISSILISTVVGCMPVQKPVEWSAIGGSRSDATVKLAYSYQYESQRPNPDINQAIHLAKSRCASWGYASAEVFGGESKVCNGQVEAGILGTTMCKGEWVVTKEFQCTGTGQDNAPQTSINPPASDLVPSAAVAESPKPSVKKKAK